MTDFFWRGSNNSDPILIGRSEVGWVFFLQMHDDLNISSFDDWKQRFSEGVIIDSNDNVVSLTDMIWWITDRKKMTPRTKLRGKELEKFMLANNAVVGKDKLYRTDVSKVEGVKNGEGPYDLFFKRIE